MQVISRACTQNYKTDLKRKGIGQEKSHQPLLQPGMAIILSPLIKSDHDSVFIALAGQVSHSECESTD